MGGQRPDFVIYVSPVEMYHSLSLVPNKIRTFVSKFALQNFLRYLEPP